MIWKRYPYLRTVICNTKPGKAFRGVLWDRQAGFLVLRNAELIEAGKVTPVDGEVVVPAENVDFLQVVPSPLAGGS